MEEEVFVLAGRGQRLGGALLDSLIAFLVTLPVMFIAGVFKQIGDGEAMSLGQQVFFFFFGLVLFLVINGYLLAKRGQTVGKMIAGTRIVSHETGQIVSLGRVFCLRLLPLSFVSQIPVIGGLCALVDTLFIFRQDRRCIHDLIAGTTVIKA
jgi:uncharacterized RDD family membrane protein YckC